MEHALFFLFSFIEFAAGLAFVLSLFRLDFTEYKTHIMYSAFLLTEISYLLRMGFALEPISLVFQMVALIVMFILMYQLPIFSAIIMGSVGYILFGLLQMAIIVSATLITPVNLEQFTTNDPSYIAYLMQAVTSLFGFFIAWLLKRANLGFAFLPKKRSIKLTFDTDNILIFSIMTIVVLTLMILTTYLLNQIYTYVFLMIVIIIQIALLIYLSKRKEKQY